MLTKADIESLDYWYNPVKDCFYKSDTELGIILKNDGTVIIDNVGSYGPNSVLFEGKLNGLQDLQEKINSF